MAKVVKLNSAKKRSEAKSRMDIAKDNKKRGPLSNNKKLSRRKRFLKKSGKVLIVLAGIFLFTALAGTIYAISYVQKLNEGLPSIDEPFGPKPEATEIYDRAATEVDNSGTRLYRVFDQFNADPVDIKKVPDSVKWAFLAAEDREFYTHSGFDIKGIIACGLKNIQGGEVSCGGSTITQQLIKLTVLGSEVAIERKVKELLMATKIEQANDKDEILQMYLTVTPYGSSIVGIETAADFYFGKEPKDLTLAEASILAAIVQNPSYLSPTVPYDGDLERAQTDVKERQMYILDQLEQHMDSINDQIEKNWENDDHDGDPILFTEDMINEAREETLDYRPPVATDKKAGHFVDYVLNELTTKNYKNGEEPFTRAELNTGGLKIITTLDYEQQQVAEDIVRKGGNDYIGYAGGNNASIVTVDPSNGQILSMAGSKDYYGESYGCDEFGANCLFDPQVNTLTSLNEPGSTNKTLAYTLAFDEGKLYGGSNLPDVPIEYPELGYTPKNWDGGNMGSNVSAKVALQESRNIPALQVMELIGLDKYIDTMEKLGYTPIQRDQVGPSLVLGGHSVAYMEHVAAFQAFANEGNYIPLDPILKILDKDGNIIYEAKPVKTEVLSPQSVFLLNQVLFNLHNISGTTGVPLSCKTGTTENNIEALELCWNSNQVTLAWLGNNNNQPLDPNNGFSVLAVNPWLEEYQQRIAGLAYYAGKDGSIKRPGYVFEGTGCASGDTSGCVSGAVDWMIQDKTPPAYIQRKKFFVCKDQPDKLARDIDKALGVAEEREFTYYIMPASRWQKNLDDWIQSKNGFKNGYPTEECNIDRSGGATGPYFYFSTPTDGAVINDTSIHIQGSALSTSGTINSLVFKLDGQNIGNTSTFQGFDVTLNISSLNLDNGTYPFQATATDSAGQTNSYTVSVIVNSAVSSEFTFQTLPSSPMAWGIPQNIEVRYGLNGMDNVKLYQIKNGGAATLVGSMNPIGGNRFRISWGAGIQNEDATYTFFATGDIGNNGYTQTNVSSAVQVNSTP